MRLREMGLDRIRFLQEKMREQNIEIKELRERLPVLETKVHQEESELAQLWEDLKKL